MNEYLIDFIDIPINLVLFHAKMLDKCIHQTFVFIFFCYNWFFVRIYLVFNDNM